MAVTANDILSYKGEAALGLGSNISSYGEDGSEIKEMNAAHQQLAYLNMMKNKEMWQQKIKDRDASYDAIEKGLIDTGNVLPQHRPELQRRTEEIRKFWLDRHGDITSNPEDWLKFNDLLSGYKQKVTQAQAKYVGYTGGMQEVSKETSPVKQQRAKLYYEQEANKPLEEPFLPYQQQIDWSPKVVDRPLRDDVFTQADPSSPFNTIKSTKTNIEESHDDFVNAYRNGDVEVRGNVDSWLESFYGQDGMLDPGVVEKSVENINKSLSEIAQKEGYTKGNYPDYLQPITLVGGQSTGTKWDDWFKIQLALNYQNASVSAYDEMRVKAGKAEDEHLLKAAQRANQYAGADQKRSAAELNRANKKLVGTKVKAAANEMAASDNAFNYVIQQSREMNVKGKKDGLRLIDQRDIPPILQGRLGIEPVKFSRVFSGERKDWMQAGYYVKPVDTWLAQDGDGLWHPYSKAEIAGYAKAKKMGVQEYINEAVKGGKLVQDAEIRGANGKTVRLSFIENTSKKGDKVFDKTIEPPQPETPEALSLQ